MLLDMGVVEVQELTGADYERAAEMYSICREKGIQGTHIDFIICAAAVGRFFEKSSLLRSSKSFHPEAGFKVPTPLANT